MLRIQQAPRAHVDGHGNRSAAARCLAEHYPDVRID
jgi:hypothetical protein